MFPGDQYGQEAYVEYTNYMTKLNLPEEFIIFDMEWTAWEGSMERKWTGPGEQREIYDIGAVLVRRNENGEFVVVDRFRRLVKLELTDKLPEYSTKLTGIKQAEIDEKGVPFSQMVEEFKSFAGERPTYAWGHDGEILIENCQLKNIPSPFSREQFRNMREFFKEHGIPADKYMSGTIVEYFGEKNKHTAHQGLDDALNQVEALNLLQAKLGESELGLA